MTSENRTDLTHLLASTPDQIRTMLHNAGIELPEELLQQFVATWPAYEAMIRRIPRSRGLRRGAGAQLPAGAHRAGRLDVAFSAWCGAGIRGRL